MPAIRYQITLPGQHASREKRGTLRDLKRELLRTGIDRREIRYAVATVVMLDRQPIIICSRLTFTITVRPMP